MIQCSFSKEGAPLPFPSSSKLSMFSQMQFSLSRCAMGHPLQLLASAVKILVKDDLCVRTYTPSLVHLYLSVHVSCSALILS